MGAVRTRHLAIRVALVAIVATVLVPLEQPASWTTPVTLTEVLDGLPAAADAGVGLSSLRDGEGPGVDGRAAAAAAAPGLSEVVEAPIAFSAVGFTAPPAATSLAVRTSVDGTSWSDWEDVGFLDVEDGPDPDTAEGRAAAAGRHTDALWVGEAAHLQVAVDGAEVADVEVVLIDSMHLNDGPVVRHRGSAVGTPADAGELNIISRAQWGADESLGTDTKVARQVHMGIIHHTAHTSSSAANTYSRDEAPGLVRAMHRYHTTRLGWADLGYNVVIDRFGRVYEGRKGGFTAGVIGAHAAGWNTGSFGVSVIGNFTDVQASAAAIDSLTEVIAVKSAIHGIDPTAWTDKVGTGAWRPTIIGHRDVGQTACPGRIQTLLPQIRDRARETSVRFPDVASTSPHRGSVLALADAGVTQGCEVNLYCPLDTLTRAQAASFMLRAFQLEPIYGTRFPDVRADGVHGPAINALSQRGWLQGYPDGTFRPHDQLTRGQLGSLLSRTLDDPEIAAMAAELIAQLEAEEAAAAAGDGSLDGSTDGSLDGSDGSETGTLDDSLAELEESGDPGPEAVVDPAPYPDVLPGSTHYDGIMALAREGVRGDCGSGRFCPNDPVLRDSTATFVYLVRQVHGLR